MNRAEFMKRLEELLADIPEEERVEALEYYEGYFEDGGPETRRGDYPGTGKPGSDGGYDQRGY